MIITRENVISTGAEVSAGRPVDEVLQDLVDKTARQLTSELAGRLTTLRRSGEEFDGTIVDLKIDHSIVRMDGVREGFLVSVVATAVAVIEYTPGDH